MADNYLERKMEEHRALPTRKRSASGKRSSASGNISSSAGSGRSASGSLSLDSLLLKNRSYRGYDPSYIVTREELEQIVGVNTKIPSARNAQALRFKLITSEESEAVTREIKLGGALPELHLPLPGTEPNAYIIICTTEPENRWISVDLGISAQSMLLKAADLGLNGICIGAFNKERIAAIAGMEPLLILAIGKGMENIQIIPISPEESHNYYRKNGVHFVPKLRLKDILL